MRRHSGHGHRDHPHDHDHRAEAWAAFAEKFAGRHGHRGGFGRHGGRDEDDGEGFGGGFGGRGGGRPLGHGDLRLLLLALIADPVTAVPMVPTMANSLSCCTIFCAASRPFLGS